MDNPDLYEIKTQAFVIRIWLEDSLRWRGHITHVPSGERRYIEDLSEIDDFIWPYLEKMGVQHKTIEQTFQPVAAQIPRRSMKGRSTQGSEKTGGAGK